MVRTKKYFQSLRIPIIQAPMAGGINNPVMVSAVANAGGVGSFGFAYSTPEKIASDLSQAKLLTTGAINANFFIFPTIQTLEVDSASDAIKAFQSLPIVKETGFTIPKQPYVPDLLQQLEPVWYHRPSILTFHFGIPPLSIIEHAKSLDIIVGITATNMEEAEAIAAVNADFIIAQGIEAGGHRGTFQPSDDDIDGLTTSELVQSIYTWLPEIPIVAAGGIMTGQDVKKVLGEGATMVQMGTAFVTTRESTANRTYKDYLLHEKHRTTVYTKCFSGRYAQGIENEFIRRMQLQPCLPFPLQNTLTNKMRQVAAVKGDGEYQSLWAGKKFAQCQDISITDLLTQIEHDMQL